MLKLSYKSKIASTLTFFNGVVLFESNVHRCRAKLGDTDECCSAYIIVY